MNKTKLNTITFGRATDVKKGWGKEVVIVNKNINNDITLNNFPTGYSGKLLCYDKAGAVSSSHFHHEKWEVFYLFLGRVNFYYYNPNNADQLCKELIEGDVVDIPPGNPHQIVCLEPAIIIEIASTDYYWDNFRIGKGDSQNLK